MHIFLTHWTYFKHTPHFRVHKHIVSRGLWVVFQCRFQLIAMATALAKVLKQVIVLGKELSYEEDDLQITCKKITNERSCWESGGCGMVGCRESGSVSTCSRGMERSGRMGSCWEGRTEGSREGRERATYGSREGRKRREKEAAKEREERKLQFERKGKRELQNESVGKLKWKQKLKGMK